MTTQSFEFVLGAIYLFCGSVILLLLSLVRTRFGDALKGIEVFGGINGFQLFFGAGVVALSIGSVLIVVALIAYPSF